jgi:cation diffusion facilitator family transporter
MAIHDLSGWQHNHAFDAGNPNAERRTWIVVAITAAAMIAEIVAGWMTGSMALLADGWHMATHVVALSIAGVAYLLARRWSRDERFTFGTWKIEVLGAFSSALLLGVVAIAMAVESVHRLINPAPIDFAPALGVAAIGLAVNLLSAWVLHAGHDAHGHAEHERHAHHHPPASQERNQRREDDRAGHDHAAPGPAAHEHAGHDQAAHDHDHGHAAHGHGHAAHGHGHHHDLNLRSAYLHVVADAFTSVLAIVALAAGLWGGWSWPDPAMGLVGGAMIAWWAKGLLADSARVLLDREMDSPIVSHIRGAIESDNDAEIADLHVWRVGRASYAAVLTVVAHQPLTPAAYRHRLDDIRSLVHVSVEVNRCAHQDCP